MKSILIFSFLVFSPLVKAQTGGIQVKCINTVSYKGINGLGIQCYKDSFCLEGITSNEGKLFLRELPIGELDIWIQNKEQTKTLHGKIFIQENQLANITFLIDSSFQNLNGNDHGNQFEISQNGSENVTFQNSMPFNKYDASIQSIQCVEVACYSMPLNYYSSSNYNTISREEISRLPVRSISGVASTVGGVMLSEENSDLHIRGSRSNDVVYYLDGMRVRDVNNIPKSYIGNVTIRTGGIPANYGDMTGGVIAIESKLLNNYQNNPFENSTNKDKKKKVIEENKPLNYDHFSPIYENDFLSPLAHPHSTFGIDVDQASWNYIKTELKNGGEINRDAVKLEEMINSFQTRQLIVPENELIHLEIEKNTCSWNPDHELVTIHLKAKDLPKYLPRKAHNFVFLIDVSGSMSSPNKLPLLIDGLKSFVQTLNSSDRVAIVTYAGNSGIVLQPTLCENKKIILNALQNLISGGSTNGIGGIKEAYRLAEEHYDPNLNNRIILATDGDFNVGINSTGDLENYISQKRGKGIYLTALGFGMGNYKNSILETLADRGDGNHFYINSLADANKVLVNDIGNLLNIARDVKLNVEFNPNLVASYRLIGYENRLMKPKDFNDDTKDGGEMGYGHMVTAVYEIERGKAENNETHFVATQNINDTQELAFVKMRYKSFEDSASIEKRYVLNNNAPIVENLTLSLIISLGLELRDSAFKGNINLESLIKQGKGFPAKTEEEIQLKKLIVNL